MAINGIDLAVALGVNGIVCFVCLLIFALMRTKPIARKFYAPRRFDPEVKRKPRRLPHGLVSWIAPVLFYPEDETISVAGLDVAVFLRLLKYGFVLFSFCTFWCCVAIMPINATDNFLYSAEGQATYNSTTNSTTGDNSTSSSTGTAPLASDLDLLSVSNVAPRSPRFWMHTFSAYVVSFVAMALLWFYSMDVSRLRAKFLTTLPRGGTNFTVLVTDVPGVNVGTISRFTNVVPDSVKDAGKGLVNTAAGVSSGVTDKMVGHTVQPQWMSESPQGIPPELEEEVLDPWAHASKAIDSGVSVHEYVDREMRDVYGDSHVAATNIAYNTGKMEPLVARYEATKQTLMDITDDYVGKIRRKIPVKKRKTVTLRPMFADKWTKEAFNVTETKSVDALDYNTARLNQLKEDITKEAEAARSTQLPAAFVTFNDRYTQTLCATGMHSYDEQVWRSQAAPAPEEIFWGNLRMRHWEKVVRNVIVWSIFVVLIIFYLPLTAVIQAIVNLDNIKKVPGLGAITGIPFVTQILKGVLPGLVLKIFLIILPPILNILNKLAGAVSVSQMDFMTVDKYFIFQVFATFLFTFFTGSALSQIQAILDDPSVLVSLLGISAPQQATFFISFILISACGAGMALLKAVPLIIFLVRSKIAGTEKARYRLWSRQEFYFGPNTPNHTIVILLGLAFTLIAPLIAPFCWLYFCLALLAQKYQLVYVLSHPYEAAGRMWINMFHQIMVGMYFMIVMLIMVLMVKQFWFVWFVIPLPFVMGLFHIVSMNLFQRPWTLMSLKEAGVLDRADGQTSVSEEEAEQIRKMYRHPGFKIDDAEHAQIISDAKAVDAALKSGADRVDVTDLEAPIEDDLVETAPAVSS